MLELILIIFGHRDKVIVKVWYWDSIMFENTVCGKGFKKLLKTYHTLPGATVEFVNLWSCSFKIDVWDLSTS